MIGDSRPLNTSLDVSRETRQKLAIYEALLAKWTSRINLIAPNTLKTAWTRHFLDSLQVWDLLQSEAGKVADFGSGGGFPGMVLAIADIPNADRNYHLIEADQRKCAFLRSVRRETGVDVEIHQSRIETLEPLSASVVVARALAPLPDLLSFAARHLTEGGRGIFLKGARATEEIAAAQKEWRFSLTEHRSRTSNESVLLDIRNLERV